MHVNSPRSAGQPVAVIKTGLTCALTLLLASATAHANSINLVQNGNFAENDGAYQLNYDGKVVADWSNPGAPNNGYNFLFVNGASTGVDGGLSLYTVTSAPGGGDFIGLDADYETGPIEQTIDGLTPGDTYDVTFDWAASQQKGYSGTTTQKLTVGLGSQTQSTSVYTLGSHDFSGWMSESFDFTATSDSEVLSFLASGSPQVPPFTLLADVSMIDTTPHSSPVPEPQTLPLLLTGLLVGAGLLKYRGSLRRSQQSL